MRFDVAMCDFDLMDVEKPPEDLVAEYLDVESGQPLPSIEFDEVVEVALIVSHNDIQELSSFLESRVGPHDLHHEVSLQHVHNFNLTVFVLGILENLFHSHDFPCFFEPPLEDLAEGALPYHLEQFDIIGGHHGRRGVRGAVSMQPGLHVEIKVGFAVIAFREVIFLLALQEMRFFLDLSGDLLFLLFFFSKSIQLCVHGTLDDRTSLSERLVVCVGCLLEAFDLALVIAETEFASWTCVLEKQVFLDGGRSPLGLGLECLAGVLHKLAIGVWFVGFGVDLAVNFIFLHGRSLTLSG